MFVLFIYRHYVDNGCLLFMYVEYVKSM
jgi:hypothetical protein